MCCRAMPEPVRGARAVLCETLAAKANILDDVAEYHLPFRLR